MCRKMMFLARGRKWPGRAARGSVASASPRVSSPSSQPSAREPRPMPPRWKRARRVRDDCRLQIADCRLDGISILGDRFVEVEQDVGNVEPGGPVGCGGARGYGALFRQLGCRGGVATISLERLREECAELR